MSNQSTNGGIGLTTILFLIFLTLKLTNNIDWSWWWVFSPLWIPIALVLSIFVFILLSALLYTAHTGKSIDYFLKKYSKKV
jgi:hypothetical protein